tara:strand:+ start:934 stop:1251 length:318 start_codon:yes stop_codon:yes gene_type:complete
MLYLKKDQLEYNCRVCGNTNNTNINKHIYSCQYVNDDIVNQYISNPYLLDDPTLPRLKNLKCPNDNCSSNKNEDESSDVVFIKYNYLNMKYLYICTKCKTSWKNK